MPRPKAILTKEIVLAAVKAKCEIKDFKLSMKLQCIISCENHSLGEVGSIFGVSPRTVWLWIKRFKSGGAEGLLDRAKGRPPSKLSSSQQVVVLGWLESGKNVKGEAVHWTLSKLVLSIQETFGITVGKTPLWVFIRKHGYRQKVPRPRHHQANAEAQADFKKNGTGSKGVSRKREKG